MVELIVDSFSGEGGASMGIEWALGLPGPRPGAGSDQLRRHGDHAGGGGVRMSSRTIFDWPFCRYWIDGCLNSCSKLLLQQLILCEPLQPDSSCFKTVSPADKLDFDHCKDVRKNFGSFNVSLDGAGNDFLVCFFFSNNHISCFGICAVSCKNNIYFRYLINYENRSLIHSPLIIIGICKFVYPTLRNVFFSRNKSHVRYDRIEMFLRVYAIFYNIRIRVTENCSLIVLGYSLGNCDCLSDSPKGNQTTSKSEQTGSECLPLTSALNVCLSIKAYRSRRRMEVAKQQSGREGGHDECNGYENSFLHARSLAGRHRYEKVAA